jgi:hypothetical protein
MKIMVNNNNLDVSHRHVQYDDTLYFFSRFTIIVLENKKLGNKCVSPSIQNQTKDHNFLTCW